MEVGRGKMEVGRGNMEDGRRKMEDGRWEMEVGSWMREKIKQNEYLRYKNYNLQYELHTSFIISYFGLCNCIVY
ncbi:hypothetical protein [Flavobacterium sp.]|uniref:hypothetical protein n=1 Tax=Flavobacterium sp. TaxID=239 RepID=UPI00391DD3DB